MSQKFILTLLITLLTLGLFGAPLNEGFDSGALPENWVNDANDGGGDWNFVQSNSHAASSDNSGSGYYAHVNSYNISASNNPVNLITPRLDLTTGSTDLSYYAWIGNASGSNPLIIDISIDGGNNWTEGIFTHDQTNTNTWFENIIDLSSYNSNNVLIRFRGISNYGYNSCNFGIDDVSGPNIYVPPYGCEFDEIGDLAGVVDTDVRYNVTLNNIGSVTDIYDLVVSNNTWTTAIYETGTTNVITSANIAVGESATFDVVVTLPNTAVHNDTDSFTITATSQSDSSFSATEGATTTAIVPVALPFNEDFETGLATSWLVEDQWTTNTNLFVSTTTSAHCNGSNTTTDILTIEPAIDFSTTIQPFIEFEHIAKTEGGWDKCYVEVSTDGVTWNALGANRYEGTSSDFSNREYFDEDSYSEWGTSNTTPAQSWWKHERFSLIDYAGESLLWVRFKVTYDSSYRYGWLLDDIVIKDSDPYVVEIPALDSKYAKIGETKIIPVEVNNKGLLADTYTINLTSPNWTATVYEHGTTTPITEVAITVADSAWLDIAIEIPAGIDHMTMDSLTIEVVSQNDNIVTDSKLMNIYGVNSTPMPINEMFSDNLDDWILPTVDTPEIGTSRFVSEPSALTFVLPTSTSSYAGIMVDSGEYTVLKFKYNQAYYYSNELEVNVRTADGVMHNVWKSTSSTSNSWIEVTVSLNELATDEGPFELFFNAKNTSSYSQYNIWIDDVELISLPAVDIKVTDLAYDNSAFYAYGDEIDFETEIYNYGGELQSAVVVDFKANGSTIDTKIIQDLESWEDTTITFTYTPTQSRATDMVFSVETNVANDENVENNSMSKDLRLYDADELTETFDNDYIPIDWTMDDNWDNNYNGWNDDCMKSTSTGMMATPELTIVAGDTLCFYAKNASDGALVINYLANETWTPMLTVPLSTSYEMFKVGLDNLDGMTVKLGFENLAGTVYVDHVAGPHKNLPGTVVAEVTPTNIEFERSLIGDPTVYETITVKNTGDVDLVITDIALADTTHFDLSEITLPDTIGYFEEMTFEVRFDPTTAGNHTTQIDFTANVALDAVMLSGEGQVVDEANSWTDAELVTLASTYSINGELEPNDQDWFYFAGTISNWMLEFTEENPAYDFYVYGPTDTLWGENHVLEAPVVSGNSEVLDIVTAGNYYVKIAASNRSRNTRGSRTQFSAYELNFTQRGMISGLVTNTATGDSLENALISLAEYQTATDADGQYSIYAPLGDYDVECSRDGFEPLTQSISLTELGTQVDFALTVLATDDNETPEDAELVELPLADATYYMNDDMDVDWYKFYLSQNQSVRIYTEAMYNTNLDAEAWLYGPHHNDGYSVVETDFDENDDPYGTDPIDFEINNVEAGYYFLRIAKHDNAPGSRSRIQLGDPVLAYNLNIEYLNGSIELAVTDGMNPIVNANVTIGNDEFISDDMGMVEIATYPVGKYPVNITANGFEVFEGDSLLVISNELTQYTAELTPFTGTLNAPRMAQSEQVGLNAGLISWSFPINEDSQWINWDNGVSDNQIGYNAEQSIDVAVRFPVEDLSGLEGRVINKVSFVPGEANAVYSIKIWKNGSLADTLVGGEVVYSQSIPVVNADEWNEFILSSPVSIDADTEYWIGYHVEATDGLPVGVDAGPMVPNKGALLNSGNGWEFLNLDYNFSIKAYCEVVSEPVARASFRNSRRENGNHDLYIAEKSFLQKDRLSNQVVWNNSRAFLGYNVYQDGVLRENMPMMGYVINLDELDVGTFDYTIKSANDEGESEGTSTILEILPLDHYQLPYEEGFESGNIPVGWHQEYVNGDNDWYIGAGGYSNNPNGAHSGNFNIRMTHGSNGDITKLITWKFDLAEVDSAILSFWHAQVNWAGDQDHLKVYYRNNEDAEWEEIAYYTENLQWTYRELNIPGGSAETQIAFEAIDDYGYGVCIDDIQMVIPGTIEGLVTDGTNPLPEIDVTIGNMNTMTDENGLYSFIVTPGTFDIVFDNTFYVTDTLEAVVVGGETTQANIALTELPNGYLAGVVTDGTDPVANAVITDSANTIYAITDENGAYSYRTLVDTLVNIFAKADFFANSAVVPSIAITEGANVTQNFTLNYIFEGNESPETATLFTVSPDSVTFTIDQTGDVDWYKVQLEANKRYLVYSSVDTLELDLEAWAYAPHTEDGSTVEEDVFVAYNDNSGEGNQFYFETNIDNDEWAFLKVQVKNNPVMTDAVTYKLTIVEVPVGSIHGVVTDLDTQLPIGNVDVNIAGQTATTDSLGMYSIGFIEPDTLEVTADVAEYYDHVDTLIITAGVDMQYDIAMATLYEGNETPENAVTLNIPDTLAFRIQTSTDADWYKFQIPDNSIWEFYTNRINGSGIDPEAWLYGPFGEDDYVMDETDFIASDDDSNGSSQPKIEQEFIEGGWYFLRLAYFSNDPQARAETGDYELIINEIPSGIVSGSVTDINDLQMTLEGVEITAGNYTVMTNEDGVYNIGPFVTGNDVTVSYAYHFPYVDTSYTITINEGVNPKYVQMPKVDFGTITYTVTDFDLETPIENAMIEFGSETYYTDATGMVTFDVAPQTYVDITFNKEYYNETSVDSVVVAEGAELNLAVTMDYMYDDRNEYPTTADMITLPVVNDIYELEAEGDVDWYVFDAEQGHEWRIFTESDVNLKAWVYGPFATEDGMDVDESNPLLVGDEDYNINQPQIVLPVEESGFYYLRISHYFFGNVNVSRNSRSVARTTSGDYTLRIESADPFTPNPIADVTLDEDFGTYTLVEDLNNVFADFNDNLTYEVMSADTNIVNIEIVDNAVMLYSVADMNAENGVEVYVKATDDAMPTRNVRRNSRNRAVGANIIDTVVVTITPINDSPIVETEIADINVEEDFAQIEIDLTNHFFDIDVDDLAYLAEFDTTLVNIEFTNDMMTITAVENAFGTNDIVITANDQVDSRDIISDTFTINVASVNDIPMVDVGSNGFYSPQADSTGFANVELDGSNSYDLDGEITAYHWIHNDTTLAETATYSHLWAQGTDTWVYLTVTDDSMATAMDSARIFIGEYDNMAPVATVDTFYVNEDTTLVVSANGVLENDTDDLYPSPIVAELITDVEQGELTLNANGLFTYVPVADFNGNITFEYAAYDGDLRDTTMVTIVVNPINDDPVIVDAGIPDQNVLEDFATPITLTLANYFNDIDGDVLTYAVDFNGSEILANADDNMSLILLPVLDWYGTTNIIVTATDVENIAISDTFAVVITPVNDTPAVTLPDTIMFDEDMSLVKDLGFYISDVDLDELSVEITGTTHISADPMIPTTGTGLFFSQYMEGSSNNKILEIYNASDQVISLNDYAFANASNGADSLGNYDYWNTFTADAEIAPGDVYVIAHPDAIPEILAQADQLHQYLSNGDDGFALVMGTEDNYVVIDRIGDWQADPGSGWDVAGVTNGTKDHTLIRKFNVVQGNSDWAVSAGTNTDDSEWIVLPQDDISGLGNHNQFCYSFTAEENWNGYEMITVSVNDNQGRAIAQDSMIVAVTPVNDAPTLNLPGVINTLEDTPYTVDFSEEYLMDVENDNITLTFTGNTNIEVAVNGTIVTFDAPLNWNGTETIYFTADDSLAQATDSTIVTFIPVNDTPIVETEFANIDTLEDFTPQIEIDLDTHFSDIDGDDLTYTVMANNEEIMAEIVDNMLHLNPVANWSGTTTISLKAEDVAMRSHLNVSRNRRNSKAVTRDSVMTSFDVTLTNVNDAPEFTSEAIITATEEIEYTYNVTVFDADIVYGDGVVITATTLPEWLTIVDNGDGTAVIEGTPLNDHVGDNSVVLSVIDNNGTTPVTQEFTIAVANVNDDPEIVLPATIEFAEDGTSVVDFAEYITDIDNADDELLLTVEGNTNIGVAISGLEVTFSSNETNWIGSETLTFTINDQVVRLRNSRQSLSRAIDSDDVVVTVIPVNDAPFVETEIAEINVDEDFDTYSINLDDHFSDPDGDDLAYTVEFNDEEVDVTVTGSALLINSITDWNGTAQITITADDNQTDVVRNRRVNRASRDQVQTVVDIVVAPVNDAPILTSFSPEQTTINADDNNTEFTFSVTATDVDSDLEYVWTINDEDQNVDDATFTHTFTSSGTFVVKVEISDEDNTLEQTWTVISDITSNENIYTPEVTQLLQNTPNPFNPTTSVHFDLNKQGKVRIDIYNVRGQLVRTLKNEIMEAGSHSVEWNGKAKNGSKAASGVYFIRMQTENYHSMKKALMLK